MVQVLQWSDTHLTADPAMQNRRGSPDAALARALERAAGLSPDGIVLTGDLADDGSRAGLVRVNEAISRFGCPVLALPGNHDLPEHTDAVFGAPRPVDVGHWRIAPIDTYVPGEIHGCVDVGVAMAQLDQLDDRPTLLVMHHPPASPSAHSMFSLENGAEFLAELQHRPHVRAIASGHLHQAFERVCGTVTVVGGPSTLYAIEHLGERFTTDADGPIGGREWRLEPDGSFTHRLI